MNFRDRFSLTAVLAVVLFLFFQVNCFSQGGWKIGIGNNLTDYHFLSSKGVKADYFKLGAGSSAFISSEKAFLDTSRLVGGTDRKSIYFQNNRFLSKVLSRLYYELGISYNQYNAIGDVQSIGFRYQTNYLGLVSGLGLSMPLGKGIGFGIKGKMLAQQLLQGTQELNSTFLDLQQDLDFNKPFIFFGGSVELTKRVNNGIILFVQGDQYSTYRSIIANVKNFNISTTNISFGIKFIP